MITNQLRQPPAWRLVFRQQFLLLVRSNRGLYLLLITLAGLLGAEMLGRTIERLGGEGPPALVMLFSFIWLVGFFWGFSVWSEEPPARRSYHAGLPVNRAVHDATRVVAGAAALMLAIAFVILLGLAFAAIDGSFAAVGALGWSAWVNYFTAPLQLYLLIAMLTVVANKPTHWLVGPIVTGLTVMLVAAHYQIGAVRWLFEQLLAERFGFLRAVQDGWSSAHPGVRPITAATRDGEVLRQFAHLPPGEWLLTAVLWLAVLSALVWLAATRRRLA